MFFHETINYHTECENYNYEYVEIWKEGCLAFWRHEARAVLEPVDGRDWIKHEAYGDNLYLHCGQILFGVVFID